MLAATCAAGLVGNQRDALAGLDAEADFDGVARAGFEVRRTPAPNSDHDPITDYSYVRTSTSDF